MIDDNANQARQSDILGVVDTRTVSDTVIRQTVNEAQLANQMINPNEVAKSYFSVVKETESKLIKEADREIKKLEFFDGAIARTDIGYKTKVNVTKNQAHKAAKAVKKRDTYLSKNYCKQTIRKDLVDKAADKVKSKVGSDLLCLRKEIGKTQTGSNLLCLADKTANVTKTTISVGNKVFAPAVKGAKLVTKGTGRMVRGGSALARNLRIQAILSAENPSLEVAKTGVLAFVNLTSKLITEIFKAIGKGLHKLLMPIIPYILLICLPMIIILIAAIATGGTSDEEEEKNSNFAFIAKNKVMEEAYNLIGQGGTKIWNYCNGGVACDWCCFFVETCFGYAGMRDLFCDGTETWGSCSSVKDWALQNNDTIVYYYNSYTGEKIGDPKAGEHGDLILYDYKKPGYVYGNGIPDHIGLIDSYNETTGTYSTIEGNSGGVSGTDTPYYLTSKVVYHPNYVSYSDSKLFMIVRPRYDNASSSAQIGNCPDSVAQWESWVIQRCIANNDPNSSTDLTKFYPAIMTLIWQESSGVSSSCKGDLMQCKECGWWNDSEMPDKWTTEQKSIDVGIRYYYSLLKYWGVTDPNDTERMKLVAQGYNYGYPFLEWCRNNNVNKWTLDISTTYSDKMKNQLGWTYDFGNKQYGNEWINKYKQIK